MKKNNQGFMLVEALVMSTVIIGVLIFMYIQFQNINRSYDKSFSYNTVTGLYITNEIREYLSQNDKLDNILDNINDSNDKYIVLNFTEDPTWTVLLAKSNINSVIVSNESLTGLKGRKTSGLSEKFNDFINYLKVDKEDSQYRLLIEFKDETYASLKLGGK